MRTIVTGFITASLLTLAMPVEAHGFRHGVTRGYHYGPPPVYRNYWVAPAVVGGIIAGAAIQHYANPPVVYVETVPAQRPVVCTEWREVRTENGAIQQERTCQQ